MVMFIVSVLVRVSARVMVRFGVWVWDREMVRAKVM